MSGGTNTGASRNQILKGPLTGPGASALKYDLLTALLVAAGQGESVVARLSLRLSLLITARYNWQRQRFAIGRREIARMWGVSERTAKREMAEMRARGWIEVVVPAARGRVAQYAIDLPVVLAATRPYWEAVGPDFVERMSAPAPEPADSTVVPFIPVRSVSNAKISSDECPVWAAMAAHLRGEDEAIFAAWFAGLTSAGVESNRLTLLAPNSFQASYIMQHHRSRLRRAAHLQDCAISDVTVRSA